MEGEREESGRKREEESKNLNLYSATIIFSSPVMDAV